MKNNGYRRLVGLMLVCAMLMGVFAMLPGASAEEGYHYTVYYYDFNEAHVDLEGYCRPGTGWGHQGLHGGDDSENAHGGPDPDVCLPRPGVRSG